MSEIDTPVDSPAAEHVSSGLHAVDALRLRSFVGLVLGLIGPRANLAVSGILLTLLVSHRTGANALAVAFALSSNQLIGWLAYPLLGRASDRTRSAVGRRAPYMAAGLFVMGACTYSYTLVGGYWPIVGLIGLVRLASVVGGLTNIAVVPEVFGKSRTLKAAAIIGILGTALGLVIKVTVIATWKQSEPSTWNLPFHVAGIVMMAVGVAVLLLVREVPAARKMADRDRSIHKSWHAELRELLSSPNGKVLLGGVFLFWAGVTATGSLTIVYFQKVLHAGAVTQTVLGWATGLPALLIGVPVGYLIGKSLKRKHVAILMPALGGGARDVQYFVHAIWQSVVLGFVSAPLLVAFVISLAADAPPAAAAIWRVRGADRQVRSAVQPCWDSLLSSRCGRGERDRQLPDDLALSCGRGRPRGNHHVLAVGARGPEPGSEGQGSATASSTPYTTRSSDATGSCSGAR